MSAGALTTLRVLDLSRVLAGPYCTQILGDYGADILKVEEPGSGDGTRAWGPPWAGDQSAYFLSTNRNKRSICIDLKSAEGRRLTQQLAAQSDVVIENFKPGAAERLGIDYPTLAAHNPRLIYCSISGYGQNGPQRDRPGYDFVIQAEGGVMSITGPEEGAPSKVGVAIVDITTGLFAATAILAALHEREQSGRGQSIDIALLDSQLAWLANVAQNVLVTGEPAPRYGNAHPSIVPYQSFESADGPIAVAIGTDAQYRRFCEATARPDLCVSPFDTNAGRVTHRSHLIPLLADLFRTRPAAAWLDLLRAIDVPAAPVNDVRTALRAPQARARAMVQSVEHPSIGPIELLGPVAKFARTPAAIRLPPPLLGEHTDTILQERLGYTPTEIARLRARGVVA